MSLVCTAIDGAGCCPNQATLRASALCAHEHLRSGVLCPGHAVEAESGKPIACLPCHRDGHECLLSSFIIEPLEVVA